MNITDRPAPSGVTERGLIKYDPSEIAAYRKMHGVTQDELASRLRVSQALVSIRENARRMPYIDGRHAPAILDAIDFLGERRERMIAEGTAEFAAIRAARQTSG